MPVPVGADLGRRQARARSSTTTRPPAITRTIDVGLAGADYKRHKEQHVEEQRGEDLRLAYVALTRAKHQAVVWWAGSWNSQRLRAVAPAVRPRRRRQRRRRAARARRPTRPRVARFRELAAAAPGCVSVERYRALGPPDGLVGRTARAGRPRRGDLRPPPGPRLAPHLLQRHHRRRPRGPRGERARRGDRHRRAGRRRARARPTLRPSPRPRRPRPARRPPPNAVRRRLAAHRRTAVRRRRLAARRRCAAAARPLPGGTSPAADAALAAVPSLLAAGPGGTAFGTFAHTVFEATDFAAPDLDAELARDRRRGARAAAGGHRRSRDGHRRAAGRDRDAARARSSAAAGCATSQRADRLDELTFELPLAGGDEPRGQVTPGAIGAVLREHLAPGDPLAGYADRLDDPELRAQRARLPDRQHRPRRAGSASAFAIADYKTNWLAAPGEALTAWHHRPAALAAEMEHAHYGLQALLYTAALHRYLRWRLRRLRPRAPPRRRALPVRARDDRPGHADRRRHARAACSPGARRRALVVALSDVLDRGDRRERARHRGTAPRRPARRPPRPQRARAAARVQRHRRARGGRRPRRGPRRRARRRDRRDDRARRRARGPRAAPRPRLRRPRHDPRDGGGRVRRARRSLGSTLA